LIGVVGIPSIWNGVAFQRKKIGGYECTNLIDNPIDNFSISEKKKKLKWKIL
jgi:hypothetical protein